MRNERIITFGGGGWKDGQVQEPCILVNPKDPSKLIMFFAGMQRGGSHGCIGKAWAHRADPFEWFEDPQNPLLRGEPNLPYEGSLRIDTALYHEARDEYWIYYTGDNGHGHAISLATCPTGADGYSDVVGAKFTRYAGNPIVSPNGQGREDGNCTSQAAIFRENELWYLFYSYRNATEILPGIRYATSRDGKSWTKQTGPDLLTAAPEQRYIEWHQVYKIGGRYVFLYEGYNGGTRWGADVAVSNSLTSGWKKLPAQLFDQTTWPKYSDAAMFHVATPALYNFNGRWYLYYQAASAGEYTSQNWALWCMECDELVEKILSA